MQVPVWLAILFPTISVLIGGFVASWAVFTWVRGQNQKRDEQIAARFSGLDKDIAQARETADLKLTSAVEKESKSRHDAQNGAANAIASIQRALADAMKEMASRTEVKEVENRLTMAMGKIEVKLDHLANLVPEMNATLKQLVSQLDRMARRQDAGKPAATE